jgi:hypothetical protein
MAKFLGERVVKCEVCSEQLGPFFIDGKLVTGPWAIMCLECHAEFGLGLGPGRGQLYVASLEGVPPAAATGDEDGSDPQIGGGF